MTASFDAFSDEILRGWEWSEHFAAQPETFRYGLQSAR